MTEMKTELLVPVEDCPNCDNSGSFPVIVGSYDEWELQQCEFCATVPWSRYNVQSIIDAYQANELRPTEIIDDEIPF